VNHDSVDELKLNAKREKHGCMYRMSATIGDRTLHAARLDPLDEGAVSAFIDALAAKCPGISDANKAELREQFQDIAGKDIAEDGRARRTQADMLIELAGTVELTHCGDTAHATVSVNGHLETYSVASKGFRMWLQREFWLKTERAPNAEAMTVALGVIASKAMFDGPERAVSVRIAEFDGAYWLDLADARWRAVRIDTGGWRIVENPPVRFIRPRGVLALLDPIAGGYIDELRDLVNVPDDEDWALLATWIPSAMRPVGPYPILAVNGEQGSAKSTLCRMLRALIDPNKAALRSEPRETRDLMIAASNGWVLSLDNLSTVYPWLSDALCRMATGGGFATRELYTDAEEQIFDAMRPVMLNGIEDVARRADLLDRCIRLTLPAIPEHKRRKDAGDLMPAFRARQPRILGALLDAVAAGLRNLPDVRLDRIPRMADFATWGVACEPALGLRPGQFLDAYAGNRAGANELAIESVAIGPAVLALMTARESWHGTATELLATLNVEPFSTDQQRKQKDWPNGYQKVSADLRRIAPNLRAVGIDVALPDRCSGHRRRRIITIEKTGRRSAACAACAAPDAPECTNGNDDDGASDRCGADGPAHEDGSAAKRRVLDAESVDSIRKTGVAAHAAHAALVSPAESESDAREVIEL